jgi:DNA-directed RNA polymerase specialized sigma24 family protein
MFNHPFDPNCPALDYGDEAIALADQVRMGNAEAREHMILGYTKLVMHKVESWLSVFPTLEYLSDDMVSEGLLAVTKAVNKIAEGDLPETNNPTGYVSVAIHNGISNFAMDEATIRVPRSVAPDQRASVSARVFEGLETDMAATMDHEELVDTKDILDSLCQTEYDRAIMDLRARGYTDAEVASQLGIPPTTVYMLRRELYERFVITENQ